MQKGNDILTTLIAGTMLSILIFVGMVSCATIIF